MDITWQKQKKKKKEKQNMRREGFARIRFLMADASAE